MKPNPNYTYLKENVPDQRMTLLQGGTRSGKTYAICYYLIYICRKYTGMEIDICRDTFTALKSTAWKDFKDILIETNIYNSEHHNKTDHIYNLFGNNISYYGADNPKKIHGRKRHILWINEAHQFPEETIDQLFPRTLHRIIADYNPALPQQHWLDKYIDTYPPLITTYKDNPFLTQAQISDIESRKVNKYWWKVYGTGERSEPVGQIFSNNKEGNFDESLPYAYGLDYGYSNDPTALVKIAVDNKKKIIYIKELLYKTGLSTGEIDYELKRLTTRGKVIVADSAEPRLNDALKTKGHRIIPATKGKDSVFEGLLSMLDYMVVYSGENVKIELSNYVFSDKKSKTPIDAYNHAIDAARYCFTFLTNKPKKSSGKVFLIN